MVSTVLGSLHAGRSALGARSRPVAKEGCHESGGAAASLRCGKIDPRTARTDRLQPGLSGLPALPV